MKQPREPVFNISYIPVFVLPVFLVVVSLIFSLSGCGLYYFDKENNSSASSKAEASAAKPEVEYKVVEVIDGDTIVFSNSLINCCESDL